MNRKHISIVIIIISMLLFVQIAFAEEPQIDFNTIFEGQGLASLIIDSKTGSIEYVNNAAVEFYGYTREQLLSMTIYDINTLNQDQVNNEMELAVKEQRSYFRFNHRIATGESKSVEVYSFPYNQNGRELLYSIIIDITPRVLLEESLAKSERLVLYFVIGISVLLFATLIFIVLSRDKYKNLATYDILTGAYSRVFLDQFIDDYKRTNDDMSIISIVAIDLDNFKTINYKYGHIIGDQVLIKFVKIINSCIPKEDFVIRLGRDEFLVILRNSNEENAYNTLKRVESKLKNIKDFDFSIEFSYGIQELFNNEDIEDAIKLADEKMFELKKKKQKSSI